MGTEIIVRAYRARIAQITKRKRTRRAYHVGWLFVPIMSVQTV